jgi:hypothetical protein
MTQVFLSHSTEDAVIARQVADALRTAGVGVWIAPDSIRPGEAYNEAIVAGVRTSDALAVLVSRAANASKHVAREVGLADGAGKRIVPIRIEPVEPSDGLAYYLNLPQWVEWHSHGPSALAPVIAMWGGQVAVQFVPEAPPPIVVGQGAVIRVRRHSAMAASARNIAILVDGEKAGEVGNGGTVDLAVQPGRRELVARIDYTKSKALEIEAVAGRVRVVDLVMPEISDLGGQVAGLLGQSKFFTWKIVE